MGWEKGHSGSRPDGYRNQARGERHGQAKLTEAQVRAIRASRETLVTLAARYGVTETAIRLVRKRLTWAWLE